MRNRRFIVTIVMVAIFFEGCMIFNTKGAVTNKTKSNLLKSLEQQASKTVIDEKIADKIKEESAKINQIKGLEKPVKLESKSQHILNQKNHGKAVEEKIKKFVLKNHFKNENVEFSKEKNILKDIKKEAVGKAAIIRTHDKKADNQFEKDRVVFKKEASEQKYKSHKRTKRRLRKNINTNQINDKDDDISPIRHHKSKKSHAKTQKVIDSASLTNSLKRPLPKWYDDAKIGIFIHWGVYSVPAIGGQGFAGEWFWHQWKENQHPLLNNFVKNTRKPGFTYQSFANEFTAEFYNPNEWLDLFEEAGAKYVVLTTKHHDGFTLWPSKYSFGWNSADVGPYRDLVGEFSAAVKKRTSMKLGLYYSLFEWHDRLYLNDVANKFQTKNYVKMKMLPQIKELIKTYQPELLWADGDWDASVQYWNSEKFLTWLYNKAPNHETIVTNDRWGREARTKLGDFYSGADRFNPGKLQTHKFENCMTLDKYSWGYRENAKLEDYMTTEKLIKEVVSTVSSNGNILINVGPSKSGMIHPIFVDRLRSLGSWLKVNGEGIYGSRPWTSEKEDENIWYTKKTENGVTNVYVFVLEYPYATNIIVLKQLCLYVDQNTKVSLLGFKDPMKVEVSKTSLTIILPEKRIIDSLNLKYAWTFKVEIPEKKN